MSARRPEALDLQATFRRMADAGDLACAMEVSSHALALHRVDGVRFAVAAFTNLTQDHLDFHGDMEEYFVAKRSLFAGGRADRAAINIDDPYGDRLAAEFEATTFSATGDERADVRAVDLRLDATGARFRCIGADGEVDVALPLPGRFNVENALCAIVVAMELGIGLADAAAALGDAERVPGRFEPVDEGQPFAVLVDYAHTPDSLENVLVSARQITPPEARVICVFGCGGDRDRDKRPLMGEIAARLADLAVVTSDNPRSEDPEAIIDEIRAGITGAQRAEVAVEADRRAAIAIALAAAAPGDTVVIAGKGHEQGQEFEHGRKIPFDDREVAGEELRTLAGVRGASVIELAPERIAAEAGAEVVARGGPGRPERGRDRLARRSGRATSSSASAASAPTAASMPPPRSTPAPGGWSWTRRAPPSSPPALSGWVFAARDPLRALQTLSRAWRRELACPLVGITGSTGKTSVKDITRALLPARVHASPENFNTEIGLPLALLSAPPETEVLICEMAMRGMGQIAELCEIAEPDVAAITNVGPVHLELLGTIEAIAEAKAEILAGSPTTAGAVLPADAEALEPHLAEGLATITFGAGGDVFARDPESHGPGNAGDDRHPRGRGGVRVRFRRAPQPRERGLRGGDRRRPRGPGAPRWRVGRRAYPSPGCGASGSSSPEAPC